MYHIFVLLRSLKTHQRHLEDFGRSNKQEYQASSQIASLNGSMKDIRGYPRPIGDAVRNHQGIPTILGNLPRAGGVARATAVAFQCWVKFHLNRRHQTSSNIILSF